MRPMFQQQKNGGLKVGDLQWWDQPHPNLMSGLVLAPKKTHKLNFGIAKNYPKFGEIGPVLR